MHHRLRRVSQCDGVGERVDSEAGGHAVGHGVPDDPVAAGVGDRAQIQLAIGRRVLGDVGQPQPVRCCGGKSPGDEVVVDRWPWRAVQATFAGVAAEQALLGAQPVDAVAAGGDPDAGELVGDEPVAELGVVVVDVDRGVDEVGVVPVALADGVGAPLVEGLLGEPEHPAGHRDRDPVGGQVHDQREHHFGRVSRAK
jgi:hypothetical protein